MKASETTLKQQSEFAIKLINIMGESMASLSVTGWFLLTSAICRLGDPAITVFPKLSHSGGTIEGLGPTFKETYQQLSKAEKDRIQFIYRRFVDSLSYGNPTLNDLRD